jgi:hypothetical protein
MYWPLAIGPLLCAQVFFYGAAALFGYAALFAEIG